MKRTIYHTTIGSPWGALFLAGSDAGLCSCEFVQGDKVSHYLSRVQRWYGDASLQRDDLPLATAIEVLRRYLSGESKRLKHPLDLRGTPFQKDVWEALQGIPPGQVATYGEIAARLGRPRGARAVGQACGSNPVVLFVPCHRVVAADGKLGGFGSGLHLKQALLRHEGITDSSLLEV